MSRENLRKIHFHKIYDKEKEFQRRGYFHKWVTYASGDGSEEYALVEDLDGNMIETHPTYMKFFNNLNATFVITKNTCENETSVNEEVFMNIAVFMDVIKAKSRYIPELKEIESEMKSIKKLVNSIK